MKATLKDDIKKMSAHNNRGTTMVETLVAFVVLMIILAILYQIVAFCSRLRMRAQDADTIMRTFSMELYNTKNMRDEEAVSGDESTGEQVNYIEQINNDNNISIKKYNTIGSTPLFYLSVDTDRTSNKNLVINDSYSGGEETEEIRNIKEKLKNYRLSLLRIEAYTYVYLPDGAEADKIIVPKALSFKYKEDEQ